MQLIGGPYAVVQVYAWANMLVSYSKESSISKAVVDTFSGEKPCCLCKQIAKAKTEESKHQQPKQIQLSEKQFQDFITSASSQLSEPISSPLAPVSFAAIADANDHDADGPLAPPPRV